MLHATSKVAAHKVFSRQLLLLGIGLCFSCRSLDLGCDICGIKSRVYGSGMERIESVMDKIKSAALVTRDW
jgi:hypothetical protein